MKVEYPSPDFEAVVAAVCHGTASEEEMRAAVPTRKRLTCASGTLAITQTVERLAMVKSGLPGSIPAPALTNRSVTVPETGARSAISEVSRL